jgi:acetyl-CoA C-acetyltransferase
MESMTNAPYLIPKARGGYRIGHGMIYDHMMLDGLEDAYERGRSMGTFAEECAATYQFTREAQDAYAIESLRRAQAAVAEGAFAAEIAPVTVKDRSGERVVAIDEGPGKVKLDKIPSLKPAFKKDGTITAASSSSINDGAAALVLMRASTAAAKGLKPLARIVAHATHAQEPNWFATAPVGATQKLLAKTGWSVGDVDLWEINEAFAVVPMALMTELAIPHDKVNVNGGACALGHPIGASGARIIVTLMHALKAKGLKKGLATLCIGGGEGTAMAIEMI